MYFSFRVAVQMKTGFHLNSLIHANLKYIQHPLENNIRFKFYILSSKAYGILASSSESDRFKMLRYSSRIQFTIYLFRCNARMAFGTMCVCGSFFALCGYCMWHFHVSNMHLISFTLKSYATRDK